MLTLKFKSLLIFLILTLITVSAVSAENETVKNTHNTDINDTKYINPNDYYHNENGEWIPYTSDTGSFNNVTMSNGYNAYSIHDSGYIETNDSKTHPSFWNDTFYVVDANDTETVVGHWYYTKSEPIEEYLKILFYTHYDDLLHINKNSPDIPSSIFVQCYVWDFYENGGNTDKLFYDYNKEAVNRYNSGFRVNNTGNIQWLNETAYRIFDFMAFNNLNRTHNDLWGLKVQLFNITSNNETNSTGTATVNETELIENNTTASNTASTGKDNPTDSKTTNKKNSNNPTNHSNSIEDEKVDFDKKTGHPLEILVIVICLIILTLLIYSAEKRSK